MEKSDLIIAGIPRSGTTLATALIDGLEDTFTFSEPVWQKERLKRAASPDEIASILVEDFTRLRQVLLEGKAVLDRRLRNGQAVTNYFHLQDGKVFRAFELLHVGKKNLSPNFLLGIKHNEEFIASLPQLIALERFEIVLVVRNPIATILSWRSLDAGDASNTVLPISQGHLPELGKVWPEMGRISRSSKPLIQKLVDIYATFCQQIIGYRQEVYLIKYEQIVREPFLFSSLFNRKAHTVPPVTDRNRNPHYPWELRSEIVEALQERSEDFSPLYPDWRDYAAQGAYTTKPNS